MTTPPNIVPAIALDGATKRYGSGATVLEGITADVLRREFVSIIGPSGCGKSTLLKMVAGLSPITSGDIAIHGMTPKNARELISFIFQDATLLPWRTVRAERGALPGTRGAWPGGAQCQGGCSAQAGWAVARLPMRFPRQLSRRDEDACVHCSCSCDSSTDTAAR